MCIRDSNYLDAKYLIDQLEKAIKNEATLIEIRGIDREKSFSQDRSEIMRKQEITQAIKKIPRVKLEDINGIVQNLTLRLRNSKVPYYKLEKVIFTEQVIKRGNISLREFDDLLKLDPFRMTDHDALLLARYFIEDNTQEFVILDMDKSLEYAVVKDIVKNIIGRYEILSERQENFLKASISKILRKFGKSSLRQAFRDKETNGYVTSEQMQEVFKDNGLRISHEELNYLVLRLFLYTNDLNKLPTSGIFEIFFEEEFKKEEPAKAPVKKEVQDIDSDEDF
eukprot:TRINITY_DN7431_c0_g3_i6.p1 TRINITY_DN7431_c0_g3~~TRINITY_DN7431_c0_g3_i6.p1  ORF type:complete len:281 (-),score=67.45 TRINITY_DN7431_c0_g3_i6:41-883(-)